MSQLCNRIQNPCEGPFDSTQLIWYGKDETLAWIVVERLTDFIKGGNYKEYFNTLFTIRAHHKVNAGEGILLRTHRHYQCAYGPQDLRGQVMTDLPAGRKSSSGKKFLQCKTLLGLSQQRGCMCSLWVTRFEDRPKSLLIKWITR